jgi:hypothetical protein
MCPKTSVTTEVGWVTSQKSEDLQFRLVLAFVIIHKQQLPFPHFCE